MISTIRRHIRAYLALVRFSISRSMEFRLDFFFRFLMDCAFYIISIAFFELLFLHTQVLAGWERHQILLFVSVGLLIDALYMTFVARSTWELPQLVNRGNLDFQLLRPINSLFFVLTRHFELASFLNVLVAAGIMCLAFSLFPEPLSFWQVSMFLLLTFNGLFLMFALRMFTILPVFWTHSELGFHMLYMALEQVSERPEAVFRGVTHLVFTTLLPFLVVTSFPARWFFNELSILDIVYAFSLSGFFCLLVVYVWQQGLKVYTSASS